LLAERIHASSQLGNHVAIDFHAAGGDQFLALAAAAQARRGQDFLQRSGPAGGVGRSAGGSSESGGWGESG